MFFATLLPLLTLPDVMQSRSLSQVLRRILHLHGRFELGPRFVCKLGDPAFCSSMAQAPQIFMYVDASHLRQPR